MARGRNARSVFVDSSAWIALVSARDNLHAEADAAFRRHVADGWRLLTTNLVLAETHRLLVHRAGPRAGRLFLERIDASPAVEVLWLEPHHHGAALAWIDRLADHRITYADASSFSVMRERRIRLALAFDRDFEIAGFERARG